MEPDGVCGYFVVEPRTLNPASQVHDLETQKRFKCPLVAGTERSNLLELDEGVSRFLSVPEYGELDAPRLPSIRWFAG